MCIAIFRPTICAVFFLTLWSQAVQSDDIECLQSEPIVKAAWNQFPADDFNFKLGLWRLPISASVPDVITEARVEAVLKKSDRCHVVVRFSFPDPKPYGIPFSFQKISLRWSATDKSNVSDPDYISEIDWSDRCQYAGKSLFPGQSWEVTLPVFTPSGHCHMKNPSLLLWGARN